MPACQDYKGGAVWYGMKACHYYENGPDDGNSHPPCVDEYGRRAAARSCVRCAQPADGTLWCRVLRLRQSCAQWLSRGERHSGMQKNLFLQQGRVIWSRPSVRVSSGAPSLQNPTCAYIGCNGHPAVSCMVPGHHPTLQEESDRMSMIGAPHLSAAGGVWRV